MLTSQLIAQLTKLYTAHGDLPVSVFDQNGEWWQINMTHLSELDDPKHNTICLYIQEGETKTDG